MRNDICPDLARLVAAHPAVFRGEPPAMESHLPAGWYELVDKLCIDIETLLGSDDLALFKCRQIKQKSGTLRFHWRFNEIGWLPIDVIGVEPALAAGLELRRPTDERVERLHGLVQAAVGASAGICETCGRPGSLVVRDRWRMTRCREHSSSQS